MTSELAAKENLCKLRGDVERLQSIVMPLLDKVKQDANHEDMGLMSFCFVNKQMEHIKSVCILVDNQQYRDAWLISRTMFEGAALLYWAKADLKRAYNWKAYILVEEFKRLFNQPAYWSNKTEIEYKLQTYCRQFLRGKSKDKPQNQIIPSDYHDSWHLDKENTPISVSKIIKNAEIGPGVRLEPLFLVNYSLPSGWVHWSPQFINDALILEDGYLDYCNESIYLGILAYEQGYNSLILSAIVFDELFYLGSVDLNAEFKKNVLKYGAIANGVDDIGLEQG